MTYRNNELIWSPLFNKLSEKDDTLIFLIAPFIQKDALDKVLNLFKHDDLKIITRWNESDLLSGVSDINIYPYLKQKGMT